MHDGDGGGDALQRLELAVKRREAAVWRAFVIAQVATRRRRAATTQPLFVLGQPRD